MNARKSRSGTTRTAKQRRAGGRPVVSITLPIADLALLDERRGAMSRGDYVASLIREKVTT